jgi:N-acetylglucosaminyl-diphospho-decaprenol L-rhamnosyltransferase
MKQVGVVCGSIVSHGHGLQVNRLLRQLEIWSKSSLRRIVLTINAPELEDSTFNEISFLQFSFEVIIIRNASPLGFSENHNRAFSNCDAEYFCVLNPDLELICDPFQTLLKPMISSQIACTYPIQTNTQGYKLDSERSVVSPWSILRRHLLRRSRHLESTDIVHWVNGAFMVFKSEVFIELNGFDTRYFMYCEDVDICLRLQLAGYRLARADTTVIHHTQRRTLKNLRHLAWHIRSLFRLWNSNAYKDYQRRLLKR